MAASHGPRLPLLPGLVTAAAVKCLVALAVPLALAAGVPVARDSPFPVFVYYAHIVFFGLAGAWLCLGSRSDRRGIYLGALFLLIAAMFSTRPLDLAARGTGASWLHALYVFDPLPLAPWLMWSFAERFPREFLSERGRRAAARTTSICLGIGLVLTAASAVAALVVLARGPAALPFFLPDWTLYWVFAIVPLLAALAAIALKTRAGTRAERRRATLFVAGLVIGLGPMAADVLVELLVPPFGRVMSRPDMRWLSGVVFYPLLLSVPLTTGYSVLVGQALSVKLLVRTALRYGLARATLIGALTVPFVAFALYLYSHRSEPIHSLVEGPRVLIVVALATAAAMFLPARRRLLVALDRRFFREEYDAHVILRALIEQSAAMPSLGALADLVEKDIDRALHVHAVTLFTLNPQIGSLVAQRSSARPLPVSSTLATLVNGSSDPLDVGVDRQKSDVGRLPEAERTWLSENAYQLLVPVREGTPPLLTGMIALGPKRSELPFSADDQSLLASIAASIAVVCQNIRLRTPSLTSGRTPPPEVDGAEIAPARECPRCGALFAPEWTTCGTCQLALVAAPVPLVLRGVYAFERRIGIGGMGVVYRARDVNLRRVVAIKALPEVSDLAASRVRREGRAMAAVNDPHLATIFSFEIWHNTPLLVVEYFDGGTLASRLRHGPIPLDEAVQIASALASGLGRLHDAGILHRDVKPSNIAFTRSGTVKLLDFGVARLVEADPIETIPPGAPDNTATFSFDVGSRTESWRMIGTPLYLSPECLARQPPDALVDLWALAIVLYESVTGANPMRARTVFETLARIADVDIPDVAPHAPDCPAFADFMRSALHRDPSRRPQTAAAFVDALAPVMARCSGAARR